MSQAFNHMHNGFSKFKTLTLICVLGFSFGQAHLSFAQSDDDLFKNIEEESNSFQTETEVETENPSNDYLSGDNSAIQDEVLKLQEEPKENPNENLDLNDDQAIANDVQSLNGANKPKENKRVKFIKHPNQKHGLYKISADGKYYYKVEESNQKYGIAIKGGAVILNQLENLETNVSFNDIYGSSSKGAVFFEYYWSYFKNKDVPNILKKARVKLGSGLLFASGVGGFNKAGYEGVDSNEGYTFFAFPNHLGLHLSFEVRDKQLIVPFVTGAFEYLVGVELQNDNFGRTKLLGQLGAHVGGGLALSLGWLDEAAKFNLDSEFGINQTYLTAELRQNIAIQTDFDFTATFLNVGLQLEF